jgi:hypothetical protein
MSWIDAEDSPPPKAGDYLAWDTLMEIPLICHFTKRGGWIDEDGPVHVSHWMPLPGRPIL